MKHVNPEQMSAVINKLLAQLRPGEFLDEAGYRLSRELCALPVGQGWFGWVLLTADGDVISPDVDEYFNTIGFNRSRRPQDLLRTLAWGTAQYPELAALIPDSPEDSQTCPLCRGSKVMPLDDDTICLFCNGLGWVIEEE